ncbi:MAG: insulinase family protein [Desulfobacterales bacterium]|nr:insulinase family protein [Desulfobacterales bacterium]
MLNHMFRPFVRKMLSRFVISIAVFFLAHAFDPDSQSLASVAARSTDGVAPAVQSVPWWPQEISDLKPDPGLVFGRLDNGFRYVLMKNQKPADRVSMHLNIQAGSIHETDSQQGVAHFLEHMLFNGTEHFKPGELVKYFQGIGMQFGPDANAHTGFSETVYDILLPDGNRESLKKGLLVMKDYARGALLLESEIDRERKVILAEKRTRDSASYRTFEASIRFELPGTIVPERLPIGKESVIQNADRALLKGFYDTWYRSDKMMLVMVGDIDTTLAASLIEDTFSGIKPAGSTAGDPALGQFDHQGNKIFYHYEKEAGKTSVRLGVSDIISLETDSEDLQRKLTIGDLADQIVQNRLDALMRRADTPFTSASIGSYIFLEQIDSAEISAECSPENWEKSLGIIEQTLRKAIEYGFTQSELDRVRKDYLSNLENEVKTASTRDSREIAGRLISSLNNNRVFQSPAQRQALLRPLIESLTPEKVHEAFKATWNRGHRLIMVTGNVELGGVQPAENRIGQAYAGSAAIPVEKPEVIKTATFPYLPEPQQPGKILRKREIKDLGIVQVDFENGVRLNLKQTDFKADEILVSVCFGRGRSSEPIDKPGLSYLAADVINESGFGGLDKETFERAMAGKRTYVSFGVEDGCFVLEGKTVSEEIPLLFQILYAYLNDPGFRPDALSLVMERFRQTYEKLSSSVDGAMTLSGKRFLAGGDSRFGLPSPDAFKMLTLEDVRSWILPSVRQDELEISVVGDVEDPVAVIQAASLFLGSSDRKKSDPRPIRDSLPRFPQGEKRHVGVPTQIPKSLVIVAYPTGDFLDIHRTRQFSVLDEVVTDRLRETVREKLGAAYSPVAYNIPSKVYKVYGVFYVMVTVAPEAVTEIESEIKAIIDRIAENVVTQDELMRALKPSLTGIKDLRKTNEYWLQSVMKESDRYPQQLEWSRTMENDYASIASNELTALAKTYLDNSRAAIVIIAPDRD